MSHSLRILLIDENLKDREYYSQRLQTASPDFVILHATTGQSGLALCQQQSVDCVVLDIQLPDMSGFEVLLKLIPRPSHPDIPVLILTGIANEYLWEAAIKNGALAALYKPMTSGDALDKAILKAIATVPTDRKQPAEISSDVCPLHISLARSHR